MEYFKSEVQNHILILHFNCAETSNAFGLKEAEEFHKITQAHVRKNIHGIILTSQERIFCSGGHLKNYAQMKKQEGLAVNKRITKILETFSKINVPTVALVQGDCFGGGLEVLSAFDTVFSSPHAFFGMWQRKISLTWGWGGGGRLKKRLVKKKLLNLLLEAKTVSSFEALQIGLIDKIYPQELLVEKAFAYFKNQDKLPQAPLEPIKTGDFKHEFRVFGKLWWNREHRSVLAKFIKS